MRHSVLLLRAKKRGETVESFIDGPVHAYDVTQDLIKSVKLVPLGFSERKGVKSEAVVIPYLTVDDYVTSMRDAKVAVTVPRQKGTEQMQSGEISPMLVSPAVCVVDLRECQKRRGLRVNNAAKKHNL